MDIVLVVDGSGSMKVNDPKKVRIEAAKMFIGLLDKGDRVAVVSFADQAQTQVDLLSLESEDNKIKLVQAIESISTEGKLSNIHDALQNAYKKLKTSKRKEKLIILMSDGKMDVGERTKDIALLEKTLDTLTPAMARKNIKIYSIAFTKNSYIPLLKLAARDTNGHFTLMRDASQIHHVFENIFERGKNPDMVPMTGNSFIVDGSISEMTVVATKFHTDSFIALANPSGEDISTDQHDINTNWFNAKEFDLITIPNPAAGYWEIKFSEGGNRVYVKSDLTLEIDTPKKEIQTGRPFIVRAWLKKNNKTVSTGEKSTSSIFHVTATTPSGKIIKSKLKAGKGKNGIGQGEFNFEEEGLYKFNVYTRGQSLDREKSLFVTIRHTGLASPFEYLDKVDPELALAEETAMETPQIAVQVPAEQAPSTNKEPPAVATHTPAQVVATADKTAHQTPEQTPAKVDQHQKTVATPVQEQHAPAQADAAEHDPNANTEDGPDTEQASNPKEESEVDVSGAVIAFLVLNLGIGGLVGGWFLYKRQQTKKAEPQEMEKFENISAEAGKVDLSDDDDSGMVAEASTSTLLAEAANPEGEDEFAGLDLDIGAAEQELADPGKDNAA
ncbi:MAG: VWA domain-containing protein [Gammaproteobacteria bacterium]|nr:VWA domain-containing protein [Gammaproteobacteria bacterium]